MAEKHKPGKIEYSEPVDYFPRTVLKKAFKEETERETARQALIQIAYAPYETIDNPTQDDWKKSYDALVELVDCEPENGDYPNTLGYLCYYGRHTGERDYVEARHWFEKGTALGMIESTYKLADMMIAGLGGPKDVESALDHYDDLYQFCRRQFENGDDDSKFADVALRFGRIFHDGTLPVKDDMTALKYLLEAQFALNRRKRFHEYGDETVEKNILDLIEKCEKPNDETRKRVLYGIDLSLIPDWFIDEDHQFTFEIHATGNATVWLICRRYREDGKEPNKVLWSVPQAMTCSLTDCILLFATDVRLIWNEHPGEPVRCNRYEYDEKKQLHQFFLGDKLQCKLMGGNYFQSMDNSLNLLLS